MSYQERPERKLAAMLVNESENGLSLAELTPELVPVTPEAAYVVQREILYQGKNAIGGWKVGAPGLEAPIQCSPLPKRCVLKSPATLEQALYARSGLELELAFTFGRSFHPFKGPYTQEEVLDGVQYVAAAIEVVSSRFKEWPDVDKLLQLADLQNHGALIVGENAFYRPSYDYATPEVSFAFDGTNIAKEKPGNPAGDPRRLLVWLVNHCASQGIPLERGTIVTTGSYTGLYSPGKPGSVIGEIMGLPAVQLMLT